jgi:hypothetical protein
MASKVKTEQCNHSLPVFKRATEVVTFEPPVYKMGDHFKYCLERDVRTYNPMNVRPCFVMGVLPHDREGA